MQAPMGMYAAKDGLLAVQERCEDSIFSYNVWGPATAYTTVKSHCDKIQCVACLNILGPMRSTPVRAMEVSLHVSIGCFQQIGSCSNCPSSKSRRMGRGSCTEGQQSILETGVVRDPSFLMMFTATCVQTGPGSHSVEPKKVTWLPQ